MTAPRRQRIRDLVLYIFISLFALSFVIVAALKGVPEARIMKWVWLILCTAAVYVQFVYVSKRFWKKKDFWILYGSSLFVHMVLCPWWFHIGMEISGIQWLILTLVEMLILVNLRNRILDPKPACPK
jgi:hypothetical protein